MRADRLLTLLMLLQNRGRMTADDLSRELEVSVRTIYRDLIALSTAGVPVFSERGPGGGVGLIEEYRTTLTGLTADEARALFMLRIPAPLAQLGVGKELRSALLKLSAALPDSKREEEIRARQRIHLDASWWFQGAEATPCLQSIWQALLHEHRLHLDVRWEDFHTHVEQFVDPYGLVAKAGVWYLVYGRGGSPQVMRVSKVIQADHLAEKTHRPPDFDLATFWEEWVREYELNPPFTARVRISPEALPVLATQLDERFRNRSLPESKADPDGWMTLDLPFESFISARTRLLGLGRAVEVLSPLTLRKSVIDHARQVIGLYEER